MSKKLAALDRFLLGLLGFILIALGSWPILVHFGVSWAVYLAAWIDHDEWRSLPSAAWWPFALGTATVVLALCALWIIISNIRHHRFNTVTSTSSDHDGAIAISMPAVAGAVGATITQLSGVDKVEQLVAFDRGHRALQYTVVANPDTSLEAITEAIVDNESDFRAAFDASELDTVYKVHYTKVRSQKAAGK